MTKDNNTMDIYSSEMKGIPNDCNILEFPPGMIKIVTNDGFTQTEEIYETTLKQNIYMTCSNLKEEKTILDKIRKTVYDCIKRRLTADRPIAFLLSGGVDSSLVASISARILGQPIRTFCCGMVGSTDMLMARKVAEHIGSNHTEVIFTPEEGLAAINDVIKTTETLQKKRVFIVYLKSNQNILNFDFKLVSTPSRKLYISSSKLLHENKKNLSNNFIISTNNKGLILAVNQKIGGKVLCKII
jgi:asparagine synthetase B (glutamine-hydrolysing)